MADKRSNAEVRDDIMKEDKKKDVHINIGVFIAALSGISAAAGALATLAILFLSQFRAGLDNFWMCCLPFVFPFITGVAVAYRKQLANVGIHLCLLAGVLGMGGAGYYFSFEPIYLERENCTMVSNDRGNCDKEVLVMMYVYAGGVACGFGVLGLLVSLCACRSGTKKRAVREAERVREMEAAADTKNRKVQKARNNSTIPRPSLVPNSNGTAHKTNGTNGTSTVDATTYL